MKQKTVLITGAGGVAVPGLIRSLKQKGYRVLAGDIDINAEGLYLADKGFLLPKGFSPDFLPSLTKICQEEMVDALIPLVDEELIAAVGVESIKVPVLLPQKHFISTCLDKYILMEKLKQHNILVPKTKLASKGIEGFQFPIIAKPRVGRGSRGVKLLSTEEEYHQYIQTQSSPYEIILQEYIAGEEFTVSVVVWRDGQVNGVVPKKIINKQGITRIAITERNENIENACKLVQDKLFANGPFNVQLRLKNGREPYIFEINPRFSTSISLTIAAGIDELNIILDQALFNREIKNPIDWKEGIVLIRETFDLFIKEEDFHKRKNELLGDK